MPTYTTNTVLMHLGIVVPSGSPIELDAETAHRLGDKVTRLATTEPVIAEPGKSTLESDPPPTSDTTANGEAGESTPGESTPGDSTETVDPVTQASTNAKPSSKTEKTK